MADNLKGIPFSSDDEGVAYPQRALAAVVRATEREEQPIQPSELYVVSFAYVLGSYKALLSTSRPDGRYFEVTHNRAKGETYVDTYVKVANVCLEQRG
jgi:hypothetical protein